MISAKICVISMNTWTRSARHPPPAMASLLTPRSSPALTPPPEVESALAAINTAHNQVSSDISLARASADQKIEQSKRAVEIETLKAQAEVEPLQLMAKQLAELAKSGPNVLASYLRNVRLALFDKAGMVILEEKKEDNQ